MFRFALAAVAALLFAVGCAPSVKIDQEDPYASLHPWNHKWKQVKKTDSGLEYIVIRKGDGKGGHPSPADRVEIHYDGRFDKDGSTFDSSYGGDPLLYRVNGFVPGLVEGLQLMQPGDDYMFWIRSDLGYGERGSPGGIPGNTNLMFRVEMRSIIPAVSADPVAWKKVTPWPTDSPDVVRTSSGLEYLVINSGPTTEEPPDENDYVSVHFEGRLEDEDHSVVASTFESQEPELFAVADMVPGWTEAIKMMRPGDHWMTRMPAHLVYGPEGDGRIPPNATVVWELKLEKVVRIDPPPGDPLAPPR